MRFQCPACGRAMIIQGQVQVGDSVTCPFCGNETIYGATADSSASAPAANASGLGIPSRLPQMQTMPPRPTNKAKKGRGNGGGNGFVLLLFVLLVAGVAFWGYREFFAKDGISGEALVSEVKTSLRKLKGEVEREGEEERDRLVQQQEREKRSQELKDAPSEKKRQASEAQTRREAFLKLQEAFANKPSYFAVSAKKNDVEDPRKGGAGLMFWAIGGRPQDSGVVYVIKTDEKGLASVSAVSEDASEQKVNVQEFMKSLDTGVWAIASAKAIWFFNTGKQARIVDIPESGADLYPIGDEIGDLLSTVVALNVRLPAVRYRLSLKPKDDGDKIDLGIIQGTERMSFDSIRKVVREKLVEQKTAASRRKLKPPKMKKFKQTFVLYDADIEKKTMNGVTYVPRTFNYLGAQHRGYWYDKEYYDYERKKELARQKWQKKYDEAKRQEARAREVEEENTEAKRAYERKLAEIENGVAVSDQEVSDEMAKYRLLIERSRTKIED